MAQSQPNNEHNTVQWSVCERVRACMCVYVCVVRFFSLSETDAMLTKQTQYSIDLFEYTLEWINLYKANK